MGDGIGILARDGLEQQQFENLMVLERIQPLSRNRARNRSR